MSCVPLPLKTTYGFAFVPSARAVRMTVKWSFSRPVGQSDCQLVSEGISLQHAVSSIAKIVLPIIVTKLELSEMCDETNKLGNAVSRDALTQLFYVAKRAFFYTTDLSWSYLKCSIAARAAPPNL